MYRELCVMGYRASVTNVSRFIGQLRKDSGKARSLQQTPPKTLSAWTGEQRRPFTARQAARLLVSHEETLQGWQKEALLHLGKADQEIERITRDVSNFLQMLRKLQGNQLDTWLDEIETDGVAEMRSFAQGLRKEYQAVKAGLTLSWSNGPTEAQVQRLKLLKRQMYGQAGFALLRQRVLHREEKHKTKPRKGKQAHGWAA
jgi:transposase